jgi:hypothetical protein
MPYKYSLVKGGAKDKCPYCGHETNAKTWKRYQNNETGELLPIEFGRCNRQESCGKWIKPNGKVSTKDLPPPPPPKPISTHPQSWVDYSLQFAEQTNLYQFLKTIFAESLIRRAFNLYQVGGLLSKKDRIKDWNNACVFWLKNGRGEVLGGKVMQYIPETGKRAKNGKYGGITWLHSLNRLEDWNLGKCLFGEHLLAQYPDKAIGIVESEKTSIIASMFNQNYLWLATGGKANLQPERLIALSNRKVILFPDFGAEESWILQMHRIKRHLPDLDLYVSTEVNMQVAKWYLPPGFDKDGFDLGDYYIMRQMYPNADFEHDFNPDANWDVPETTKEQTFEELFNF